ncbi:MAG: RHS repeat-associated core domain-containing protein, partial [Bacteroidota bacterium]
LHGVTDQSSNSYGVDQFLDDGSSSNHDYTYDANGNLTSDNNKGITTITYNHLNKPTVITFSDGRKIEYLYDATGTKLRQKVFDSSSTLSSQLDYINAFHYEDSDGAGSNPLALSFITHDEGRVRETSTGRYYYEMHLQDHLGNNRILFADLDDDGTVEKKQEDHFYPFGMRMAVSGTTTASPPNRYLYNGKELQTDHGLNWSDYGARMYDASIARWNGVDALSEKYSNLTPFNYVANNPVIAIDPNGEYIYYINSDGEAVKINKDLSNIDDPHLASSLKLALEIQNGQKYIGSLLNSDKTDVYIFSSSSSLNQTHEARKRDSDGNPVFEENDDEGIGNFFADFGAALNGEMGNSKNADHVFGIHINSYDLRKASSYISDFQTAETIIHEFMHVYLNNNNEHSLMGWIGSGEIILGELEISQEFLIREGSMIHETYLQFLEYFKIKAEETKKYSDRSRIRLIMKFLADYVAEQQKFDELMKQYEEKTEN